MSCAEEKEEEEEKKRKTLKRNSEEGRNVMDGKRKRKGNKGGILGCGGDGREGLW